MMGAVSIRAAESRKRLLAWYRRRRRDLPWRRTRDPYAVWISEVMLQQTRVATVVPYYERFLARFPDVATLAAAPLEDVLAQWSGLGYYRRARHLHAAAAIVARDGFPKTAKGLRALPGIGEYTANAVASIAFGEPVAVVDGNVERVTCRLAARDLKKREVREHAQAWLSRRAPGNFNQAVMELGATVCTPRAPACPSCPVRAWCRARSDRWPTPRARPAAVDRRVDVLYATSNGRVQLVRRNGTSLLDGFWELPETEARDGDVLATVRHGVLNQRLSYRVRRGGAAGGRWFTAREVRGLPLTTAARKCLKAVGFLGESPS